jgi:hypothetical protein
VRQLTSITSSSKKIRNTYAKRGSKRASTGPSDDIFNGNNPEIASPRSSPSPFPPHIHEAVQDAAINASAANNRQHRSLRLAHPSSSADFHADNIMAYERESSVVSAGNDADQDPSSSPRSTTTGIRQLELNRSSSPAKRKLDGGYDSPSATGLEQDFSAPKRQKSPKDEEQITSPLPSRHKPIPSIEIDNRDASNIDMADSVMEDIAADVDDGVEQVIGHGQIEDKPTLNDQVRTITKLAAEAKLVDGVKVYLVANRWLNRVVSRTTSGQHQSFDKDLRDGVIGPVDNSSIVANGKAACADVRISS